MVKGRFAPSPTGRMHLGNIYCALMSYIFSKSQGGKWLLRIEDLDPQRSKKEYADLLMDDLNWLGLEWDEGPFYQSERSEIYLEHFKRLETLTYPCFCKRADLLAASAPHTEDGRPVYAGTCRNLSPYQAEALSKERIPAWRIKITDGIISFDDIICGPQSSNLEHECGDFIIRRADQTFAYQLAVVVDDALMGVNQIIRGDDLLSSTPQQLYLYDLLGYERPTFGHIPLMCADDGRRLCKRNADLDMEHLRANFTPEQILGKIATATGLTSKEEPMTVADILSIFSTEALRQGKIII